VFACRRILTFRPGHFAETVRQSTSRAGASADTAQAVAAAAAPPIADA